MAFATRLPAGVLLPQPGKLVAPTSTLLDEKFKSLESAFDGVLDWMIELYDKKTGGFCESIGMAHDPKFPAHIQGTTMVLGALHPSNLIGSMPAVVRTGIINFLQDNQDPVTGLFCDKAYPEIKKSARVDRHLARLTAMARRAFVQLNATPLYTISDSKRDGQLPYLKSLEAWEVWLRKTVNNSRPLYGSLDDVGAQASLLLDLPEPDKTQYIEAITSYINPMQDKNTGLWDNSMNATFKYVDLMKSIKQPVPNAEKIVASIFEWFHENQDVMVDNTAVLCNPVRMLPQLDVYIPARLKTDNEFARVIDWHIHHFKPFKQPDGAFSRWQNKFPKDVMDVHYGTWDKPMADVNGNAQPLAARGAMYRLVGREMPPLPHSNGFWDRFTARHEI